MVVILKIKYVDDLPGGGKRFRKRHSKVVIGVLGKEYFQVPVKARDGAALVSEQEIHLAEYEKIEKKAKRKAAGQGALSPLEHWLQTVAEATALMDGFIGNLSEDDKRDVLAEDLYRRGADPMLLNAVMAPDAEEPPASLQDAKEMYRELRVDG